MPVPAEPELQRKALHIIMQGINSKSMMACLKLWLRAAGVPAGYARRPFTNFDPEQREALIRALLEIDEAEALHLTLATRIRENRE